MGAEEDEGEVEEVVDITIYPSFISTSLHLRSPHNSCVLYPRRLGMGHLHCERYGIHPIHHLWLMLFSRKGMAF